MNKQEAIEKIKNIETLSIVDRGIKNQVLDIIFQIDEPQKVVVPKFVAEWIEWCKANDVTLLGGISPIDELGSTICSEKRVKSRNATRWAKQNQETFARAWLDGYEIEQEKLYTVEIPDPHGMYKIRYLFRNSVGNIRIGGNNYRNTFLNAETHLTEAEIKQDFEWAFQFAKPVEE